MGGAMGCAMGGAEGNIPQLSRSSSQIYELEQLNQRIILQISEQLNQRITFGESDNGIETESILYL